MTENEKRRINELHLNGYGYKKIAKELGLSVNTVKSHLARARVEEPVVEVEDICPNCGNKMIYTPGHKKKKFCSDKCRMSWWNSHLDKVNRLANRIVVCAQCKQEFTAYGKRERKYCGRNCYFSRQDLEVVAMVPLNEKYTLTIKEASRYFSIGIKNCISWHPRI